MRRFGYFSVLLWLMCLPMVSSLKAQGPQDCITAIPICQDIYVQTVSSDNEGLFPNEIGLGNCLTGGEINSIWYSFTVESDGELSFVIDPVDPLNDYDWILFDVTNATCEDIPNDPSLVVGCNSWGDFFPAVMGPTGMSTSMGGVGSNNGPGTFNGPPFCASINVTAGQQYILMVEDFSQTPDGYTLDFSESTAGLFDAVAPEISNIEMTCHSMTITFSENIDCSTIDFEDFQIEQNSILHSPSSIASSCVPNGVYTNEITLTFSPSLPANNEDFVFSLLDGASNSISDVCGNIAEPVDLTLSIGLDIETTVTPSECDMATGSIDASATTGGSQTYMYTLDDVSQTTPLFENLSPGIYSLLVDDFLGCTATMDIEVESVNNIDFTAGLNEAHCEMTYELQGTLPTGYTGEWTSDIPVNFLDTSDPTTTVEANQTGTHLLTWTISSPNCGTLSDSVLITFTNISSDIDVIHSICEGVCDGMAATSNLTGGSAPYSCMWTGGIENPLNCTTSNLCDGLYGLEISDSNGCIENFSFEIANLTTFEIDSIEVFGEICKNQCDGRIQIHTINGNLFSINGGSSFASSPAFIDLCSGNYDIVVQNNNGCQSTANTFVPSAIPPEANFDVVKPWALWEDPVFQTINLSENHASSYWQFDHPNNTLTSELNEPQFISPIVDIRDYQIMLTVTDSLGCQDSIIKSVALRDDVILYVPNAFSPNEDGVNEIFKPILNEVDASDYVLSIYDRTGNIVFQTRDIHQGWNGQSPNASYFSMDDVYTWSINFKSQSTVDRIKREGFITIIR